MSSASMDPFSLDRFGEGMMTDILNRLSAEELTELQLVCRKWYKVIHHPYFMKTHLLRQQQYENMLVQAYDGDEDVYETTTFSLQNERFSYQRAIGNLQEWTVHASCNGLLLIQNRCQLELLAIANPVTKWNMFLPHCEADMEKSSFGFVYVPTTEIYHVIHLFETKSSNGIQYVECWEVTLKYEMSTTDMEGMHWNKLWGTNFSKSAVRVGMNTICLDNASTIWKNYDNKDCLSWNSATGKATLLPLPPSIAPEDPDQRKEYFLLKRGEELVYIDYNHLYTMVRIHLLNFDTKQWTRRWVIGLSDYQNMVGFEVDEITPYFIARKDLVTIFGIGGHIIESNQFGPHTELGMLSGKTIIFCANHVPSVISLKEARTFPEN